MTELPHARAAQQNVFMDRFRLEPKTQRVWGTNHALWFTLMGVGGGVFVLGRWLNLTADLGLLLGVPVVDLVSFVFIAVGGLILIADLGRPLQAWRAFVNVRTSVISWGAWGDLVFLVVGAVLVLPALSFGDSRPFSGLGWDADGGDGVGFALELVATVAAFVVMTYAGVVLARPRAIPYWHSPAVPLQFLASSLAMAMGVVLLLAVIADEPISAGQCALLAVLVAATLVLVFAHLRTHTDAPGKRESIHKLLEGEYRPLFLLGAIVAGLVVPLVLELIGAAASGARDGLAVVAVILLLVGGYLLRLLTLKVGIFPPVRDLLAAR